MKFKIFSYLIIFLFPSLLFLTTGNLYAQKSAFDIKNANEVIIDGTLTAYRINTKWGVYNNKTQVIIAKPLYAFVLPTPYGFLAVTENKIGYYASNGKIIVEPKYEKLGFTWNNILSNEFLFYFNDTIFAAAAVTDSVYVKYVKRSITYPWTGNQLHNLHCRMVEVKNDKLIISDYDFNYRKADIFEEKPRSGLYDLSLAKWDIPRECNYLVSFNNKYVGIVSANTIDVPQAFNYRVYNYAFEKAEIIADPYTHLIEASEIAKFLPYENVSAVEYLKGPFVQGGVYKFNVDAKFGLFQLDYLRVIQEPVYEEIISLKSCLYLISVKNSKIGFLDPYSTNSVFEPMYDSLFIGGLRDAENTGNGFFINGKWQVLILKNELENVYDSVWRDDRMPYANLRIQNSIFYVEDVIPKFYSPNAIQIMRGTQTVDSLDINGEMVFPVAIPEKLFSGIYNLKNKKWIVPQKYKAADKAGNLFYGAFYSGAIKLADVYNLNGDLIMPSLSAYMELTTHAVWSEITKTEGAERVGRVECDTTSTKHNLYNAVYIKINEQMGVFDLLTMQWILNPEFTKIAYLSKENRFTVFKKNSKGVIKPFSYSAYGKEIKTK